MKKFKKVIYALTSALITMSTYGVMLTNAETTNDIVTELKADNDISSEIVSGWTTEVLSRQLALYICSSHLPARVVPESELSDGLSKDYVYIEYDPERADVVDTINDHISKRMLDKELFRFYEVGTVSKPLNKVMNYSFDEFSKLSTAEVEALFTENGFTEDKGYKVWTPENYLREVVSVIINEKEYAGILRVFFKANDYDQIAPENAMDTEIYCSDEKLKSDLSLPEEKLSIEQKIRRTFFVGDDICTCLRIEPKSTNINRNIELKIAAMNFVQLSPRFAGFDIEYLSDPKGHTDIDAVLKEFYSDDRDMEERKSFFVISENHITNPDEMNPQISETEKKELTALQKYAEEISEYMHTNQIDGDAYAIYENNVEKLVIEYSDEKEEIRAYISKLNIDDKLIKYNRYVWMNFDNDNTVSTIEGDANCDGELSMADAVLIMQSLANPAKFGIEGTDEHHITEQGKKNADISGENDGITNADALAIQMKLLGLDNTVVAEYEKTIDWYGGNLPSGVWELCRGDGNTAVITSANELKTYIEQVAPKESTSSYIEKYNDSYFKDNVLLINSVNQSSDAAIGYEFDRVDISDNEINISIKSTLKWGEPAAAMVSLCIAQVSVPQTSYNGQPVNWTIIKSSPLQID